MARIGGREVVAAQQSFGPRVQQSGPQIGPTGGGGRGLSALASVLAGAGQVGQQYYAKRIAEEDERIKFTALQSREAFAGEFARRIEANKMNLPANGAGYLDMVDKEFSTGWTEFMKSVPETLRPEFQTWGESFRQQSLMRADGYQREAGRANSTFAVQQAQDRAQRDAYLNPGADVESGLAETISNAPYLTELEKQSLAAGSLQSVRAAGAAGQLRNARQAVFAVPYSSDVRERIFPALIHQESRGRADAESPVGASGLAQVMPGTGRYIAEALNDRNFPHGENDTVIKTYLKRPEVSRVYGLFYLNEQLKRFGGDVETSLVAYNWGPENAARWAAGGKVWDQLPEETQDYLNAIIPNIGGLTPDGAREFDLSFEQTVGVVEGVDQLRGQAQSDAQAYMVAQTKAAQERNEQQFNQLVLQAEAGQDVRGNYAQLISTGQMAFDPEQFTKIRTTVERVNKDSIDTQQAFGALAAGDTLTPAQADKVITPDLREGMLKADEGAMNSVIQRVDSMGFVPPTVERALGQMMASPNIQITSAAGRMIAALPEQVQSRLPQELVTRAIATDTLVRAGVPQDQIQNNLIATSSPEQRKILTSLKKNDDTYEEMKFISAADIADTFDSYLPGDGDTQIPRDPGTTALLQQQYSEVFDMYYNVMMDSGRAKTAAVEHISKQWGPTEMGGDKTLMWLPPEKLLGNFVVNRGGERVVVRQPPEAAKASFERVARAAGLENYGLVATDETLRAAQQGQPIPYIVLPLNAEGQPDYSGENLKWLSQPLIYNYEAVARQDQMGLLQRREQLQRIDAALMTDDSVDANSQRSAINAELLEINRQLGE